MQLQRQSQNNSTLGSLLASAILAKNTTPLAITSVYFFSFFFFCRRFHAVWIRVFFPKILVKFFLIALADAEGISISGGVVLFYRWDFRWWMLWLMLRAYLYLVFLLKPSLVKVGYLHLFVFNSILHWINWNKFRFLSFFWNHSLVEFFIGSSNYTLATTWYCLKHYLLMVVMEWVLGMQINNTNEW